MEERRRWPRFEREVAAVAEVDGRALPALALDLGLHGARLRVDAPLAPGARLRVRLDIPTPPRRVTAQAEVRWAAGGEVGVAFTALRPGDLWALLTWVGVVKHGAPG